MSSSRSNARLVRFCVFAVVLLFCGYVLTKGSSYSVAVPNATVEKSTPKAGSNAKSAEEPVKKGVNNAAKSAEEPVKKAVNNAPGGKPEPLDRVKAAFVTLVRNSDLSEVSQSIKHIEDRFNKNYHYDWVFLNDEEFTEDFKKVITSLTSGQAKFGKIPTEHWSYPTWIDKEKAALSREQFVQKKVIYGGSESYRHMCRFESGFFFQHDLMKEYEYYWRVEPSVKIFCDVDYDIFQYMKDNDKWYGWIISLPEYKETIPTLWETTKNFMKENPQYIAKDNNMAWISDDGGETYNRCHFWSNFEIGAMKLWRSEAYQKYFNFLDQAGGFFYERWGDAPVHSIAASLLMPKDKIHFFHDVGYFHVPFNNCPVDEETRLAKRCVCEPKDDFTWRDYSCTPKFFTQHGLKRPKGWENFTG